MRRSLIVAFGLGVMCAVALPHHLDLHRLASAMGAAVSAPVINDVTTDFQNPPAFVKARHGAMSDSYKAAVARHYADLQPLRVPGRDAAAVLQAGRWQQLNGAAASAAAPAAQGSLLCKTGPAGACTPASQPQGGKPTPPRAAAAAARRAAAVLPRASIVHESEAEGVLELVDVTSLCWFRDDMVVRCSTLQLLSAAL